MNQMEEFADYLPEGVNLTQQPKGFQGFSMRHESCLCGVDMEATAAANGYYVTRESAAQITFTLLDVVESEVPHQLPECGGLHNADCTAQEGQSQASPQGP